MNWLVSWLMKKVVARKLAAPVTWVAAKVKGHRTEIATALFVLTYPLEMAGLVPATLAEQNRVSATAAGLVTGADKIRHYAGMAEEVARAAKADPPPPTTVGP